MIRSFIGIALAALLAVWSPAPSFSASQIQSQEEHPAPGTAKTEASPQSQNSPPGKDVTIKVNVGAVLLNVSVIDRRTNRSLAGLEKSDFTVYEDGVRQEIDQLLPTQAPFNLMLLMDVSGSTASYVKLMRKAAVEFTREINKDDRVAVAVFNSKVKLLQNFTDDRKAAEKAISHIRSGGGTAFYDALMACMNDYMTGVEGRKAIVVFTDGVDNRLTGDYRQGSKNSYDDVLRKVQESNTIVYTIFLDSEGQVPQTQRRPTRRYPGTGGRWPFPVPFPMPQPFPTPSPSPYPSPYPAGRAERAAYERAEQQLAEIADQTGGRFYMPKEAEDLWQAYSQVADDLRIQYLLYYSSTNQTLDDHWRSIRVEVDRPGAVVRTRKGYRASPPGQ